MTYTPPPCSSSEAAAVATVRGAQQLRRAAVLHHPQAERAVVHADILAADEPAGLADELVDAATCVNSHETSCSDGDHRSVDATFPERVRAICESVLRLCESRFRFSDRRSGNWKAESADGSPASGGGGRVKSSRPPNT